MDKEMNIASQSVEAFTTPTDIAIDDLSVETPPYFNDILIAELPYYIIGNLVLRSCSHELAEPSDIVSNHLLHFYALMVWGVQEVRDNKFTDAELQWLGRNVDYCSSQTSRVGLSNTAEDEALAATTFYDAVREEAKWNLSEFPEEPKELGINTETIVTKLDRLTPLGLMALTDLVARLNAQVDAGLPRQGLSELINTIPAPIRMQVH